MPIISMLVSGASIPHSPSFRPRPRTQPVLTTAIDLVGLAGFLGRQRHRRIDYAVARFQDADRVSCLLIQAVVFSAGAMVGLA